MDSICEALITAIQKRPAIYDKLDENYTHRSYINAQWREIADEIGIPEQAARKKWTCMRDYFIKQNKQLTSTSSKPGSWPLKKKRWYLYDNMAFLLPYINTNPTSSNLTDDDVDQKDILDDNDDTQSHASFSSFTHMPSGLNNSADASNGALNEISQIGEWQNKLQDAPRRKKPRFPQDREHPSLIDLEMIETLKHLRDKEVSRQILNEDEDELFFKSLMPKLKNLDPIARMECEAEIHSVVLKHMKRSASSYRHNNATD